MEEVAGEDTQPLAATKGQEQTNNPIILVLGDEGEIVSKSNGKRKRERRKEKAVDGSRGKRRRKGKEKRPKQEDQDKAHDKQDDEPEQDTERINGDKTRTSEHYDLLVTTREVQHLPGGMLALLNTVLQDDEYEKSASLIVTMAQLLYLPPDSMYVNLFDTIKRAGKRREAQTLLSALVHIQRAFPPSSCSLVWRPVHSPPTQSDWDTIYGLLVGVRDALAQPKAKEAEKKKKRRFSDDWKEQDEEGVHIFNLELLLRFFIDALEEDIKAQPTKQDTMLHRLLYMDIHPVLLADGGADSDGNKNTYETNSPLEVLMNVVFSILRLAEIDLFVLLQHLVYLVCSVCYTFANPLDSNAVDLVSNLHAGVTALEFSKKILFLNTMKHHGTKMALLCTMIETEYERPSSVPPKLAKAPLSIHKMVDFYAQFTTKETRGRAKGKGGGGAKKRTMDRFVRHPQEMLVILLSMLLQGVICAGVHRPELMGARDLPNDDERDGKEKEKEKDRTDASREPGNETEAEEQNRKIREELQDDSLMEVLKDCVGEICEYTRDNFDFTSNEFKGHMLALENIMLCVQSQVQASMEQG